MRFSAAEGLSCSSIVAHGADVTRQHHATNNTKRWRFERVMIFTVTFFRSDPNGLGLFAVPAMAATPPPGPSPQPQTTFITSHAGSFVDGCIDGVGTRLPEAVANLASQPP